jgi:hypothetical protein
MGCRKDVFVKTVVHYQQLNKINPKSHSINRESKDQHGKSHKNQEFIHI